MLLRPFVAASLLLIGSLALADTYIARVVGVTDGDTVRVLDGTKTLHKIRLAGIDAPERTQPFGQRSKQYLAGLVFGRDVTLDCGKLDRYKREVCVVILDGQDINLSQVRAGYSWWYRQYAREQRLDQRKAYAEAEAMARETRTGLWSEKNPTPPWEWRHRKRTT